MDHGSDDEGGVSYLDTMVEAYLAHRVGTGEVVASSSKVMRAVLRQWVRFVDGAPPRAWTVEQVSAWCVLAPLSPAARKSRLHKLRPFAQWLIDEEHLDRDPTRKIARIPLPARAPRDLTVDECRRVVAAAKDDRTRLICLLMAHIGLRDGDVARIRVEDIDTRHRGLAVRAKGGRGEPSHWDPIPEELWTVLQRWRRDHPARHGPLLRSYLEPERGIEPKRVGELVTEALYDSGVKEFAGDGVTPHCFRHSCAEHMLDNGATLRDVQFALGHKDPRSTGLYTLRPPKQLRDAMEGRSYLGRGVIADSQQPGGRRAA